MRFGNMFCCYQQNILIAKKAISFIKHQLTNNQKGYFFFENAWLNEIPKELADNSLPVSALYFIGV